MGESTMRVLTGWMKVGPVFLLMVAGQTFAAINDSNVYLPLGYRTMQPPARGSAYTDPAFGTSIKRISNAMSTDNADIGGKLAWIVNEYSTASPFNNDNYRLILVHQSYFGLYDGNGTF